MYFFYQNEQLMTHFSWVALIVKVLYSVYQ